ncbi:MAG: LCP family protein [Vallitalea sp.]|nr:LCP family protein [Vallitalea sp.]
MDNKKRTSTLLLLIVSIAVVILAAIGILLNSNHNELAHGQDNQDQEKQNQVEDNSIDKEEEQVQQKPQSINVLLIGFDKSNGLTDVIMVGNLDTDTNKVKLISLPRDLFIDFREENFKDIKKENNIGIRYCKLTEVYSNAGWDDNALLVVKDIVQEITNINIDYTTAVNIDGFKQIVDSIGGVEFYVPKRMKYTDKYQDLYINLKEGLQVLDGDKAEQLVRNRKYYGNIPPDYQRMKIQQDFLLAMTNKIISIRDFDKITDLAKTVYGLLKTDFGLLVVNEYVDYLYNLDLKELLKAENMTIIPSNGEKIDGIWYQTWDKEEVLESINSVYNN